MYCKLNENGPRLPEELKKKCIDFAQYNLENKTPMAVWYSGVEKVNQKSLAYTGPNTDLDNSGGVGFYFLDDNLNTEVRNFLKFSKNLNKKNWTVQVVTGGNFVGPHMDDPQARKEGYLYMLKNGGSNVLTRFYHIKDSFRHLEVPTNTTIPYDKLDIVEEYRLEEDNWYWLNFNQIHSVENQESVRLALYGSDL